METFCVNPILMLSIGSSGRRGQSKVTSQYFNNWISSMAFFRMSESKKFRCRCFPSDYALRQGYRGATPAAIKFLSREEKAASPGRGKAMGRACGLLLKPYGF